LNSLTTKLWDGLTSLKLTIVCLAILMILVVACTLAQVNLGTFRAVDIFMRSWIVWWDLRSIRLSLPVFPGGALVGLVLMANLAAAQLKTLELSWRKAGLWIVHAGLIMLFVGEFITGLYQTDTRLAVEVGQTVNFVESPREQELAVIDETDAAMDDVFSVPDGLLARGGAVAIPGTPLTIQVRQFMRNARLANRTPRDPPSLATAGIGSAISAVEIPPVSNDDSTNATTAFVEPIAGGRSYGTWLVSSLLGAPQRFVHEGHSYRLELRRRRWYLPYSLTLKQFRHDVYAGTDIPKNFSSLVQLKDPGQQQDREVLIYMNQPFRYDGKAFYQASFGEGDRLSILQVVSNPGWLLPYIACVLVGLGLIVHFGIVLRKALRKRAAMMEEVTA
jgi:hypothetical protein